MKLLNGGNVVRLPLDQIEVGARMRAVSENAVTNLMLMAEDTGITTPIHVRKVKTAYVLIDGGHRLEVSRRLGLPDIAALVVECRADEARAMEASNNLGAARMTPLQTAVFVASWKRDYYAMHPDRKPGAFFGNQFTQKEKVVTDKMSLTTIIADAFGVDERTAFRALRAGENLTPEEVAQLDRAEVRISMQDLKALSKIGEPEDRARVVAELARGVTTAKAIRSLKPAKPVVTDHVELSFKALRTQWHRAPKAARIRFLKSEGLTVFNLLREIRGTDE